MKPSVAHLEWRPSWRITSSRLTIDQLIKEIADLNNRDDVDALAFRTASRPNISRFSDGSYKVFYAANDLDTAIAETKHHRERLMRKMSGARPEFIMRVCMVDLVGGLHDLRGQKNSYPLVYDNDNYAHAQHLAKSLREDGSNGVAYDSLRRDDGECVGVFHSRVLSNPRLERYLRYVWDGERITVHESG